MRKSARKNAGGPVKAGPFATSALVAAALAATALVAGACATGDGSSPTAARHRPPAATSAPSTTTTSGVPRATSSTSTVEGPVASPPLPAPGPGFVPGHVTAVGDSVMLDYAGDLEQDVPGITVTAAVSRGWTAGETRIRQLEASGQLGAVVVVDMATNGPVTAAQFGSVMALLSGASRVVFVNTRVDRTWQTSNNAIIASGAAANPRAVVADWYSLAAANPGWLYATQTHMPIDGTGASALAALVAGKV